MDFRTCFQQSHALLMEGALGERLKRTFGLEFDEHVAMAGLVHEEAGRAALQKLWLEYAAIAQKQGLPFLATTPTRRANRERVGRSQFDENLIGENVRFLKQVLSAAGGTVYAGGLMGCKGDAYRADDVLARDEAEAFHGWQAGLFQRAGADFLFAGIMPALPEAVGMARAIAKTGLPYLISFMIRENGRLIDGTTIHDAIVEIDASADPAPLGYLVNCVHPLVLRRALEQPFNQTQTVQTRFCGIQANTSPLSPEELDQSADLKCSDATTLAEEMMHLRERIHLKIAGGCCGTDGSHMEEIAARL